jgi:hypothetical protein
VAGLLMVVQNVEIGPYVQMNGSKCLRQKIMEQMDTYFTLLKVSFNYAI